MLRLKEVASQSETFSKRMAQKQNAIELSCFPAQPPAGRLNSFLLTGRLYWLLRIDIRNGCDLRRAPAGKLAEDILKCSRRVSQRG